jgi:hypothetical protein
LESANEANAIESRAESQSDETENDATAMKNGAGNAAKESDERENGGRVSAIAKEEIDYGGAADCASASEGSHASAPGKWRQEYSHREAAACESYVS